MNKNYKHYSYFIILISVLALAFAYTLQLFDIYPCRLCIYQRYIYYGLIISSIILIFLIKKTLFKVIYYLELFIYFLLIAGISIGVFQVLIEEKIIDYESSCSTSISNISSSEELFTLIDSKDLVACDIPQIVIFHLSLSAWNVIYMIFILCVSLLIMYKRIKIKLHDRK